MNPSRSLGGRCAGFTVDAFVSCVPPTSLEPERLPIDVDPLHCPPFKPRQIRRRARPTPYATTVAPVTFKPRECCTLTLARQVGPKHIATRGDRRQAGHVAQSVTYGLSIISEWS